MSASKITQHEFDTTTRVCKHCGKDSKDATATNCFERSIEASMDLVATLVKQLQIRQEEDRKRQEEDRKRQEEDRKRQEEDRKRQEEDRKRLQTVVEGVEGLKAGILGGQEEDRKRLQTVVEGVEGLKVGMLGGVFHSDILIQTEIPAEIRKRQSINGSWVGTNTKEGKAITTFISNQVLGLIDDSWKVNLDEFASVDQEVKNFADFTKHSALYAALNVENDNQYNIKVNIQDSKKHVVHLTTRPDFLILPKAYATKNQRLDQVYLQTILFVEVISGEKTEDEWLRQLLTTLRAVAAHTGKHARLYGIVVDRNFTQARLATTDVAGVASRIICDITGTDWLVSCGPRCAARTQEALFGPQPRGTADVTIIQADLQRSMAEQCREHFCNAAQRQNATLCFPYKATTVASARSRLFHNLIRTTQRPPGYVAHNISRDPGLVDCTVDLCGHIGLHSPSPSPQCG
eukprot:g26012.t1